MYQVFTSCTLINLYGSTEVAGDVTYFELASPQAESNDISSAASTIVAGDGSVMDKYAHCVPIGFPISNNDLFVVSKHTDTDSTTTNPTYTLCPDGEEGELLMVGEHVAAGYYHREEENRLKFIENPLRDMDDDSSSGCGVSEADWEKAKQFGKAFLTGRHM